MIPDNDTNANVFSPLLKAGNGDKIYLFLSASLWKIT